MSLASGEMSSPWLLLPQKCITPLRFLEANTDIASIGPAPGAKESNKKHMKPPSEAPKNVRAETADRLPLRAPREARALRFWPVSTSSGATGVRGSARGLEVNQ